MNLLRFLAWLDTQFIGESGAQFGIGVDGFGTLACTGLCGHQLSPQALPQGVLGNESAQFTDGFAMLTIMDV